jgi:xanthine/uracil/vitamin C permease (AzgA family)
VTPPLLLLLCSQGKRLHSPTLWLGAAGLGFMAVLMAKRVKGALMLGIVFTTAISWIPGHAASYLGAGSQVPGGREHTCCYTCDCIADQCSWCLMLLYSGQSSAAMRSDEQA